MTTEHSLVSQMSKKQHSAEHSLSTVASYVTTTSLTTHDSGDNAVEMVEAQDFEVQPLSKHAGSQRLRRVSTIKRQIARDNQTIVQSERDADLADILRREFTMEDTMRVLTNTTHLDLTREDEESGREKSSLYDAAAQLDVTDPLIAAAFAGKDGAIDLPPDGGYGWVCVLFCGIILFCTWGSNSAFGVYLAYYIDNDVFPGATKMDFAWIAGLMVCMASVLSPFALILDKVIGLRTTMSIAVVLHTTGYILASFATELWHLYVCQGVLVGSAYSLIVVPAVSVIPDWFLKYRALASGLLCMGTGLGGVVFSLSVNALIHHTGNQRWSLRMVGIITGVLLAVSCFFIKRRTSRGNQRFNFITMKTAIRAMFNPRVFLTSKIWFVSLWFAISILGYTMTLFSYASAAVSLGMSQAQASQLTAIINAAQTVGRPLIGVVADKWVGRVNYTITLNLTTMILILGFWKQCRTYVELLICGILLGLFLGAGNVMNPVLIADAFDADEFGCAWATLNVTMGLFSLFSEVIALSLQTDSTSNPFEHTQIFGGCTFLLAVILLLPLRQFHTKNVLKRRKNETEVSIAKMDEDSSDEAMDQKLSDDREELEQRLNNYDSMLEPSVKGYLVRVFYPVKV